MRNLLAFVRQIRGFLAFALLQFIALYFYYNYMSYGQAQLFNTSSSFIGWIQLQKSSVSDYFYLQQENQRLMEENAALREKVPNAFIQLQESVYYINDTIHKRQFQFFPAHVLNSTYTKRNNFLTLDKGRESGIKYGMGVMSNSGVVGYVIDASRNFSLVKTVLSQKFNLSAQHKNTNYFGLLKWNGDDPGLAQLHGVPKDAPISEDDTIVTKGSSAFFPANVPIGTIKNVDTDAGNPHYIIDVQLANSFESTYNVYIIDNLMKKEMKNLELKAQKNYDE